ncbi:MAG: nuclear transport factor 2 family protein, partial [Caulobacteraceae bacterium]
MAVVKAAFAAFNRGDMAAGGAKLAPELSIVDSFPPYEWHGSNAWRDWQAAFAKTAWTDPNLPVHIINTAVSGDDAYVVFRGDFTWREHGRRMSQLGTEAVSLHRGGDGWKITGWG